MAAATQAPGKKPGNCQDGKTATGQPEGGWKLEGQNHFGRPKSSKIWKSVVLSASELGEGLKERESAPQAGAPEPGAPSEPIPCLVAGDEAPREAPQTRGERKKAKRRVRAASLSERSLDKRLLVEMSRWTAARPVSQRGVDILRESLEVTGLSSTPVFTLLIQVLRIDKEGCMKIIRDKMNQDAQSSSENKQPGEKVRRGPYLHKVKDSTISVGNGQTMEINRFKLASAPQRDKPRTVQELLAAKRRAQLLGAPRQLIIQQPLRLAVLAQPVASPGEGPVGPAPRESEQTHPTSPIHTRASRRGRKPVACPAVRRSARVLRSGRLAAAEGPGAPPPSRSSQAQPAAAAEPAGNLQPEASSGTNAAPVKPGTANARAQRFQRIAPAPAAQPKGVVVPLMLPNSTVPIMAVLTPQGLLCIPPAVLAGLPKPNDQSLASQATPQSLHQAGAAVISTAPPGEARGTAVQAPAGSAPASGEANWGGQPAVDRPIDASIPITSGAKPAPTQPLTSPSPAACSSTPPLPSSPQIHQIQAPASSESPPAPPAPTDAGSLTAGLPVPGAVQQPAANRIDSAPPRTAHLNQGAGPLPAGSEVVPRCLSADQGTKPGGSAQREGTSPPTARPQPDKTSVDFKLLSHEQEAVMKDWLQGEGGVRVPGLPATLPYLPPFASTLRAFSNLLLHKKVLERDLSGFAPANGSEATDPKARLEAARVLVGDHLRNNPAHQLLKARFLSAFTLPAFLATLPPRGTRTTVGQSAGALGQESAGESEYEECTETDGEGTGDSEGSEAQCDAGEVTNRELSQPFEISFADLSFDSNLAGSLETIVEDPTAPEEPSGAPESETEMPARRSRRLRKKP